MTTLAVNVTPPICPDCGTAAELIDSALVYGTSYGPMWRCPRLGCDVYVGTHPDGRPLGTLAGPRLRKARIAAHAAFDRLWKKQGMPRRQAYRVLAERLGVKEAHISQMDEAECARVVELFSEPDVTVSPAEVPY